jgi:hypothetical protein
MTDHNAPVERLPMCPSCGNCNWYGPICRTCHTNFAALSQPEAQAPDAASVERVARVLHEKFGVQCSMTEYDQWLIIARAAIRALQPNKGAE